jgi:NAD(P)-dependent dehydrogenase (short-subunit alcohol dehydrogenase family)
VYAPAIGVLARLADTDADMWRRTFDTNVTGAAIVTRAAIGDLCVGRHRACRRSARAHAPWPGLGAYLSARSRSTSWSTRGARNIPTSFSRIVVGDCAGGEGDGLTQFANAWNTDRAADSDRSGWPATCSPVRSSTSTISSASSARCSRRRLALDPVDHGDPAGLAQP